MKQNLQKITALLLALALTLALAGCSTVIDLSDEEEEDTTTWAEAGGEITLPDGVDTSAHYSAVTQDGIMYISFNGIQKRDSAYFSAPNGSLTFTASATVDENSLKQFKIAVWKLADNGTEYVEGSTIYIPTDGSCYTYTLDGLDPSADYRLTLSYDRTKYYMYGQVTVSTVGAMGERAAALGDTTEDSDA